MTKKLKTTRQIKILSLYFNSKPKAWPQSDLIQLSKITGLSRNQVYKWLWDQRNICNQIQNKPIKNTIISLQKSFQDQMSSQDFKKNAQNLTYKKVLLKNDAVESITHIPSNLTIARTITLSNKTSDWYKLLLQKYGVEMVKLRKKQEVSIHPLFLSQFIEIKEEEAGQ